MTEGKINTINTTARYTPPAEEKKSNTILWVGTGVVLLIVFFVLLAIYIKKRISKKAKKDTSTNSPIQDGLVQHQQASRPESILSNKLKAFNRWISSSRKRQGTATFVVILLFAAVGQVIVMTFAATTEYSQIPEVAKMQKLTEEVVALADSYAAQPDTTSTKKGANEPNQYKVKLKGDLISKVKERKDAYLVAMMYDPQLTVNNYLAETIRTKLPDEAKAELEQNVEVNGIWVNGINEAQESFGENTETTQTPSQSTESHPVNEDYVYIRDVTNADVHLYATALPRIRTGFVVKVKGVRVGNSLAVARPKEQSGLLTSLWSRFVPQVSADAADDPTCKSFLGPIGGKICETIVDKIGGLNDDVFDQLIFCEDKGSCRDDGSNIDLTGDQGKRKTLVIPMNFKDDQVNPLTISEIDDSYQSLATIYDSMSYGKFKPQYDVYQNWTTITDDDNIVDCNPDKLSTAQQQLSQSTRATLDKDVELATKIVEGDYTDVMYVYNRLVCSNPDEALTAGGWAAVGYNQGEYLSESVILLTTVTHTQGRQWLISAMAHELGHSYGLDHAHGACNEGAPTDDPEELDLSKYCTAEFAEYADPYNIMGRGTPLSDSMSFNFANKVRLNWVSDSDDTISVPAEGGQYTINALHKTTGKRALKLRYKDKDLYIEYRPKTDEGTDRFVDDRLAPGLLNYYSNEDRTTSLIGGVATGTGDNLFRTYERAGSLRPYKIGSGDDEICVIPSGANEESISIQILKDSCPKDEITNYVYEKAIAFPEYTPAYGYFVDDIDVDKNGNIYAINNRGKEVVKLDSQGNLLKVISIPFDIVTPKIASDDSGNIYVATQQQLGQRERTPWLLKYDKDGNEIARWGPGDFRGIANGISHDYIVDIAVDSKGDVYALYSKYTSPAWSDYMIFTVFKLDSSLKEITTWGLPERYTDTAMDLGSNNLHIFGIGRWNGALSGWNYLPENCIFSSTIAGDKEPDWCNSNAGGTFDNENFGQADHMEMDQEDNYLILSGSSPASVDMYNRNHSYVGKIGQESDGFAGIKVAPDGKLYAISRYTHENVRPPIKVFSPNRQPIEYRELLY